MTGRELLFMYARLRGVPEARIPEVSENLIQMLLIQDHADKVSKSYRYVAVLVRRCFGSVYVSTSLSSYISALLRRCIVRHYLVRSVHCYVTV